MERGWIMGFQVIPLRNFPKQASPRAVDGIKLLFAPAVCLLNILREPFVAFRALVGLRAVPPAPWGERGGQSCCFCWVWDCSQCSVCGLSCLLQAAKHGSELPLCEPAAGGVVSGLQLCGCLWAGPLQGLASRPLLSVCIVQEEQALKSKMGKQTEKKISRKESPSQTTDCVN